VSIDAFGDIFAKNIFSPLNGKKNEGQKTFSTYLVWENGLSGTFFGKNIFFHRLRMPERAHLLVFSIAYSGLINRR
jgi:hypothetical protein